MKMPRCIAVAVDAFHGQRVQVCQSKCRASGIIDAFIELLYCLQCSRVGTRESDGDFLKSRVGWRFPQIKSAATFNGTYFGKRSIAPCPNGSTVIDDLDV